MDELLSGAPCLALVRSLGEIEGAPEKVSVDLRVVRLDLGDQLVDEMLVMSLRVEDGHRLSVLSTFCEPCRARRNTRRDVEPETLMHPIRRWLRAKTRAAACGRHARRARSASLIYAASGRAIGSRARAASGTSPIRASCLRRPPAVDGEREAQLGEDATCLGRPRAFARAPQAGEALAELFVAFGGVEEPPDHELGSDCAVPPVLLQPAGDVEEAGRAKPVELGALAESDRAPCVPAVLAHAEAQMLALARLSPARTAA